MSNDRGADRSALHGQAAAVRRGREGALAADGEAGRRPRAGDDDRPAQRSRWLGRGFGESRRRGRLPGPAVLRVGRRLRPTHRALAISRFGAPRRAARGRGRSRRDLRRA